MNWYIWLRSFFPSYLFACSMKSVSIFYENGFWFRQSHQSLVLSYYLLQIWVQQRMRTFFIEKQAGIVLDLAFFEEYQVQSLASNWRRLLKVLLSQVLCISVYVLIVNCSKSQSFSFALYINNKIYLAFLCSMNDLIKIVSNNIHYWMKIIDRFYLITFAVIVICLPISFYIKITEPSVYTYHIAIYGDTIDTSMLAYYIDQGIYQHFRHYQRIINFNITLISTPQVYNQQRKQSNQLNKMIYSFCGVQKEWMNLVENTNLKYSIKQYGVYFGQTIQGTDKNQFQIYSTESSLIDSMMEYGLSNYAAYNFFLKFAKNLNSTAKIAKQKYRIEDLTTLNIIKRYFPNEIEENSLKYFSDKLGLDPKYINKFIFPVIMGNYLHQANSLSTLYKLLPVYCHKAPAIGKSLAIYEQSPKIQEKILANIKTAKLTFVQNKVLQTYSIVKDKINQKKKYVNLVLNYKNIYQDQNGQNLVVNDTLRSYLKSDVLFIFDDDQSLSSGKQFYYYKTVIDGKIKNDELYEQFFTVYLKANTRKKQQMMIKQDLKKERPEGKMGVKGIMNQIYSITRVCALNCKGYQNSVYILISKHRIVNSKHLEMFQSHDIKLYKKFFVQKSQMPTNKKLQQNQNVYKLYNIESISDSYQLQLNLVKQIAQGLIDKIKRQFGL